MKIPPGALTAPSLCPRCDAPAGKGEQCGHCAIQLRQCGNCQGVAGPFDRHCGFCGFELIQGERRSPLWRLWLLAALVPLTAGLAYGLWTVTKSPSPPMRVLAAPLNSGPLIAYKSRNLAFQYSAPRDWSTPIDYSRATEPAKMMPYVVVARLPGDQARVVDARGDLLNARPQGAVVVLGRPAASTSVVGDQQDAKQVLAAQVAPLLANPQSGTRIDVIQPVTAVTINGRPAAKIVLKVTRDGAVYYLERAVVYAPATGVPAALRVEAAVAERDWDAGDADRVEAVLRSLKR